MRFLRILPIINSMLIGLVTASICFSQNITIRGKVTDASGGTLLTGAVVKLEKQNITTTTDANGDFTLSGSSDIHAKSNQLQHNAISVSKGNNVLHIKLHKKSSLEIATYTLHGRTIFQRQMILDKGKHSLTLPQMSAGIYIHRIKAGESELTVKSPSLCRVSGDFPLSNSDFIHTNSEKRPKPYASINDVIAVTKDGYLNYRVMVTNSDTSGIEIKMIECAGTVSDIEGNVYQSVKIGNQVWTVENLRTTKYNDGSPITLDTSSTSWDGGDSEMYCYYNNTTQTDSIKKYGALYNWHAVNTGKLAPTGWHVPSKEEWEVLQSYLIVNGYNWDGTTDSNRIAKSLTTKTDWMESITSGAVGNDIRKNNSIGFSALPGGYRFNGYFIYNSDDGFWWSSSEYNSWLANCFRLVFSQGNLRSDNSYMSSGRSVRLVRDAAKSSIEPFSAGGARVAEKVGCKVIKKIIDSYRTTISAQSKAVSTTLMIPNFEPVYWSEDGFVRDRNNCYNYANNRRTDTYGNPGEASGQPFEEMNCDDIEAAVLRDGLEVCTGIDQPIPAGKARVALCVDPGTDFHWYREDRNGMWSHKAGKGKAQNSDNSGRPISDPEKADRGAYTDFCGFYFVDSDSIQGHGHENICRSTKKSPEEKSAMMKVTIMMYSGREDPFYHIYNEKLFARIKALLDKATINNTYPDDAVELSLLGYRGVVIQNVTANQSDEYTVNNKNLEHTYSDRNINRKEFLIESSQTLEKILVDEALLRDVIDDGEYWEIVGE